MIILICLLIAWSVFGFIVWAYVIPNILTNDEIGALSEKKKWIIGICSGPVIWVLLAIIYFIKFY